MLQEDRVVLAGQTDRQADSLPQLNLPTGKRVNINKYSLIEFHIQDEFPLKSINLKACMGQMVHLKKEKADCFYHPKKRQPFIFFFTTGWFLQQTIFIYADNWMHQQSAVFVFIKPLCLYHVSNMVLWHGHVWLPVELITAVYWWYDCCKILQGEFWSIYISSSYLVKCCKTDRTTLPCEDG